MVSKIESALRKVTDKKVVEAARLRIILSRYRIPMPNLTSNERKALIQLKEDKDIMILPSDKGRAVVVADIDDYDSQLRMVLKNSSTYQTLKKVPTPSLERKMNSIVWGLHKKGELPRPLYDTLWSTAGLTPRLYGLLRSTSLVYPYGQLFPSSTPPLTICPNIYQFFCHLWWVIRHLQSGIQLTLSSLFLLRH